MPILTRAAKGKNRKTSKITLFGSFRGVYFLIFPINPGGGVLFWGVWPWVVHGAEGSTVAFHRPKSHPDPCGHRRSSGRLARQRCRRRTSSAAGSGRHSSGSRRRSARGHTDFFPTMHQGTCVCCWSSYDNFYAYFFFKNICHLLLLLHHYTILVWFYITPPVPPMLGTFLDNCLS